MSESLLCSAAGDGRQLEHQSASTPERNLHLSKNSAVNNVLNANFGSVGRLITDLAGRPHRSSAVGSRSFFWSPAWSQDAFTCTYCYGYNGNGVFFNPPHAALRSGGLLTHLCSVSCEYWCVRTCVCYLRRRSKCTCRQPVCALSGTHWSQSRMSNILAPILSLLLPPQLGC